MLNLFWDYQQQLQIAHNETAVSQTKRDVLGQDHRLRDVEQQLARVTLVSQALWELLRERTGITEDELLAKIGDVDLRDGRLDGKLSPQTIACPKCERTLTTRHSRCIYCGTNLEKPNIYQ